ncbi:restriction endonuclease subunit S [Actinomadura chokoriensis]|uniref:restriction endonuclease subunit S n=1 Tax=Actinomadura chokoriensis TaxID=454156 RepID=UPI0031F99F28
MSRWPIVRFEELAAREKSAFSKPYGSAYTKADYSPHGVPLVRGVNLGTGRFHDDDFVYITSEKADTLPGANLAPGDLVITHRGTIGQVSMIPRKPKHERYVLSTSQVKARLDQDVAIPEFYYYWLTSPAGQQQILQNISTVGVPGLAQPVATVKSFRVPRPPVSIQIAIAEFLGALDDKIAVNDRIARKADALRSLRLTNILQGQQTNVTEVPLSSLADFVNGRAFTKNASGTGRMVVRIAELNSGPGASTVYNTIEVPDKHIARPGDVLFAWSGSLCVARWFRDEAIVNQHIFKVIPNNGMPSWLLHDLVQSKLAEFQRIAADKATTMGHIQRRHLDEPVRAPDETHIPTLDGELRPLWDRALLAERESLGLTKIRDALLPKLMSGQVRIRDAERVVEDVV